ncbi:MAG: DUF4870 domain-containing protein [Leptolyngbyaceae cyanobacterium bins.302]|nr:DUF4870 domain-containing protein [Leptolyngbyaceae cyanobacterium bins.302]
MSLLPLSIRIWAAAYHLSVVVLVPLLLVFFKLLLPAVNAMDGMNSACVFKPIPECNDQILFTLFLVTLAKIVLLWSLPFVSILMIFVLLRMRENIHPFIKNHGREALRFQLKLASYSIVIHAAFLILLALLKPAPDALASNVFLILGFDYFFFPIFAGVQVLSATVAAKQALRGRTTLYPEIRW